MFDSVLDRGQGPKSRFGAGAVISFLLHAGLLLLALYLSRPQAAEEDDKANVAVTFKQAMPPPPPPPPPPAKTKKTKTTKTIKKPDQLIQPKEIPQEKPQETEEAPEEQSESDVEEGVEGGVEGGVVGGVVGGVIGGVVGGQLGGTGTDVLPFGEGMTRPVQVEGRKPEYTREAIEARVQGLMIVKCVITVEGRLEKCRIIKPVPHMEQAVLSALATHKYKPVMYQGRPISVDYTFNIRLSLPR